MAKLKTKCYCFLNPFIQSQPCDLLLHPTLLKIEFRASIEGILIICLLTVKEDSLYMHYVL